MTTGYLLGTSICVFALAYRYYSAFIAAKVLALDDRNTTPAISCHDGRDFLATNKWVVFGHHFAAIAGAGPLIGPTLAAQYGWGPGFYWILLGSVFAGCVHDMIILFASVQHKGQGLAIIARKEVGPLAGTLTAIVTLFILIITMAGLSVAVVNALYNNAWGVFSIAMTVPVSMAVGAYIFRIRPGAILSGTIAGVVLIGTFVFLGENVAESGIANWFMFDRKQLSIMLPVYSFLAAVLPTWLLLTPRGYLSTYMKIGVIGAIAAALIIANPTIHMPMFTQFVSGGGPIIPGPVWPYVFITIACGAISGFHSLIGSGTTPKMLEKETHVRLVGYGAMLVEGFVAIMALLAAVIMYPGDYFAINSSPSVFAALNMPVVELPELSKLVGLDVSGRPGGAISLAVGMAHVLSSFGDGIKNTMKYWFQFIIMFEAIFILTTIDSGTRVARYMMQDIMGCVYKPFGKTDWVPGVLASSAVITCAWGCLLYTGDISSLWPMFGVTNQVLSSLSLAIGTTLILRIAKNKYYAMITGIPCLFVTVTTFTAGMMNLKIYWLSGSYLNAYLSMLITVLVLIAIADNVRRWITIIRKGRAE